MLNKDITTAAKKASVNKNTVVKHAFFAKFILSKNNCDKFFANSCTKNQQPYAKNCCFATNNYKICIAKCNFVVLLRLQFDVCV